eukprot:scaffold1883_cov261-Pinguiococcus_pyrenoidosus.AAC.27
MAHLVVFPVGNRSEVKARAHVEMRHDNKCIADGLVEKLRQRKHSAWAYLKNEASNGRFLAGFRLVRAQGSANHLNIRGNEDDKANGVVVLFQLQVADEVVDHPESGKVAEHRQDLEDDVDLEPGSRRLRAEDGHEHRVDDDHLIRVVLHAHVAGFEVDADGNPVRSVRRATAARECATVGENAVVIAARLDGLATLRGRETPAETQDAHAVGIDNFVVLKVVVEQLAGATARQSTALHRLVTNDSIRVEHDVVVRGPGVGHVLVRLGHDHLEVEPLCGRKDGKPTDREDSRVAKAEQDCGRISRSPPMISH